MSVNLIGGGGSLGEKGEISDTSDGLQNDPFNIAVHISNTLIQNSPAVQQVLQQCRGVDGSFNMYCVMECLVKSPAIRDCLRQTNFQAQLPKGISEVPANPYGAMLVQQMLVLEDYFTPCQQSYYLLYQSFPPNPSMGLAVISQRYSLPQNFETEVLQQLNCRMCNQSILNYLLIELRRDKDLEKFWNTVDAMIQIPELKDLAERYRLEHENMLCVQDQTKMTWNDEEYYEYSGEAADAIPPSECGIANTDVNMSLHRKYPCHFRESQSQDLDLNSSSESTMMPPGYHLMELIRNDEGVSPEQQKLDINAEIDRLVDDGHISYHDMAEVCLTIQTTKKELLSARTALGVLKKYYQLLFESLPEDYMALLDHINQNYPSPIPSHIMIYITAPARAREVNQRILDLFIGSIMNEPDVNVAPALIGLLMNITKIDSKEGCENFGNELLQALFDDKYSSEQTRQHMTTHDITTMTEPVNIPSTQSLSSSGDHDNFYPATTQPAGDPNQHGIQPMWTENKLYSPAMPYSSEYSIMSNTQLNRLAPKTLAVIKKYYDQLWKNFPADHKVSLERYCGIKQLTEASIKHIATAGTSELANKRLLHMMTYVIHPKQEDSLFRFCSNLEVVIGSSDVGNVIEHLRNDLVEAIFEEASSSPTVPTSEPFAVSPRPWSTSQAPMTKLDKASSAIEKSFDHCYELVRSLVISLPKDYKKTVEDLRQYLTDEAVSDIMASPNYITANNLIIIRLMKTYGDHLTTLLSVLKTIKDAPALNAVINRFKEKFSNTAYQLADFTAGSGTLAPPIVPSCHQNDDPMVFTILEANQTNPELVGVLRKYYDLLLSSFPENPNDTQQRLCINSNPAPPYSHPDTQMHNQMILDHYITMLALSSEDCTPSLFCMMMSVIIGNTHIAATLEKELLDALNKKEDVSSNLTAAPILKSSPKCPVSGHFSEEGREASLSSFDDYYDLMLKVNSRFAKGKFLQAFVFPNGDPLTGNLALQPNEIQMEVLLAFVRNLIGANGVQDFFKLVEIFCNQEPYSDIGFSLLDVYHAKGGHGTPSVDCHKFGGKCLSIMNLVKKLEYHSKQLLEGLQYQPPKSLPQYYVPQPELLQQLTQSILDNGNCSMDIDVCLGSMKGYGKSTLVKGLCYQRDILEHFCDGFLWIKLGAIPQDPIVRLKNIYHQLTSMAFTGNSDLLIESLKYLATNYLQRLLVIINDVSELDHVAPYLRVFRQCKVIVVTSNRDLFSQIFSRHHVMIKPNSLDHEMSLKLVTMQVKGFEKPADEHIVQLRELLKAVLYWPVLLGIVHCQLLMFCNKLNQSPGSALQKIMQKLQMLDGVVLVHRYILIVTPIVETSLEFLESEDISRLNQLLMTRGISTPRNLLPHFWNVSEEVADGCVKRLISSGLIQYDEELLLTETSYNIISCVEIHPAVAQCLAAKMYNTSTAIIYV